MLRCGLEAFAQDVQPPLGGQVDFSSVTGISWSGRVSCSPVPKSSTVGAHTLTTQRGPRNGKGAVHGVDSLHLEDEQERGGDGRQPRNIDHTDAAD